MIVVVCKIQVNGAGEGSEAEDFYTSYHKYDDSTKML